MSIKKEKTNNKNEIKITFTVEPERFDEAIEHVFKENAYYQKYMMKKSKKIN